MKQILHDFLVSVIDVCNIDEITHSHTQAPIFFEPTLKFEIFDYRGFRYLVAEGSLANYDITFHRYNDHSISFL